MKRYILALTIIFIISLGTGTMMAFAASDLILPGTQKPLPPPKPLIPNPPTPQPPVPNPPTHKPPTPPILKK